MLNMEQAILVSSVYADSSALTTSSISLTESETHFLTGISFFVHSTVWVSCLIVVCKPAFTCYTCLPKIIGI